MKPLPAPDKSLRELASYDTNFAERSQSLSASMGTYLSRCSQPVSVPEESQMNGTTFPINDEDPNCQCHLLTVPNPKYNLQT